MDDRAFLADLVAELQSAWGQRLVSVVLYGSRARGDARPDSDIDLLIVAETFPERRGGRGPIFRAAAPEAMERFQRGGYGPAFEMSPVYKTPAEASYHSPLYLDMTLDARLLHDRGDFFRKVLDEMRARMAELGSKRVVLPGGAAYWDLKPDYKPGENIES